MAASKPSIVGRLAIKIQPDTTGFNTEIKTKLKQARDTINDTKIDIQLNAKVSQESIKSAQRRINSAKEKMSDTVDLPVHAKGIQKAAQQLRNLTKNRTVKITVKMSKSAMTAPKKAMSGVNAAMSAVNISAAMDKIKSAASAASSAVSKLGSSTTKGVMGMARLAISATRAGGKLARVALQSLKIAPALGRMARNGVKAATSMVRLTLSALRVGPILKKISRAATSVAKHLTMVAAAAMALGPAVNVAMAASVAGTSKLAGIAVGLGQALVTASGAAALLPGALAVAGIAALGIKSTINEMKEELADLGPEFKAAFQQAGVNAVAVSVDQVRDTAEKLLPVLQNGFAEVGTAIGGVIKDIAATIGETRNLDAIKSIFTSTAAAIQPLGTALSHVLTAFLAIARVGADYMPTFSRYLADIAQKFADWATAAADSGQLYDIIDAALITIKQLGSVLKSVFGIVKGVFGALSAGNVMPIQVMAATLEDLNQTINSVTAQNKLVDFVQACNDAISAAQPGLKALISAIGALEPVIADIFVMSGQAIGILGGALGGMLSSGGFASGLHDLFAGILDGISKLAPAIASLGALFGPLGRLIGTIASALGDVLGAAIQTLVPILGQLANTLTPVIAMLERDLVRAISSPAMSGSIFTVINAGLQAVANAAPGVIKLLGSLKNLVPVISTLLTTAGSAIGLIAGSIADVVNDSRATSGISAIFTGVLDGVAKLTPAISQLGGLIGTAGRFVGTLASELGATLGSTITTLTPIVDHLLQRLTPLIHTIGSGLRDAVNIAAPVLQSLGDAIIDVLSGPEIGNGIGDLFTGVVDGVQAIIPVITQLSPLIAAIGAGVGELARVVGQILADTLPNIIPVVTDIINQITPLLAGIGSSFSSMVNAALPGISALLSSILNIVPIIDSAMQQAGPILGQIANALASAFNNPALLAGFSGLITGVLAGLQNLMPAIEALTPVIGNILGVIGHIAEVLGSTLSDSIQALAPVIQDVLDAINVAIEPIGALITDLVSGGLVDAIDGILNGLIAAGPGLGAFIESLGSILSLFGNIAESAGPTLGILGEALASVFNNPEFQQGIQMLFDGLFEGIEGLKPGIEALAPLVGSLGGLLGPLLGQLGRVIGVLVQALAPALISIFDKLSPLVKVLGDSLVWAIKELEPLITWLGDFLGDVLAGAVNVVIDAFDAVIALLTGDWGKAWEYAKRLISDFVKLLKDTLGGAINGIGKFFGKDWHIFGSDFGKGSEPTVTPTVAPQDLDKVQKFENFQSDRALPGRENVTNITINNPINEPSSESIRRNSRLAGLER